MIYNNDLSFTKIRYWKKGKDTGKLYITDGSNDGYIDLETGYFYWMDEVYNLTSEVYEIPKYGAPLQIDKRYERVEKTVTNYQFWGSDSTPSIIKLQSSQLYNKYVQVVKPKDDSQDWSRMDNYTYYPTTDEAACQCSTIDRWIEDGEMCDGVNRCKRYKYQWKYDCESDWIDYEPLRYKVGDIIELDSSQCGTYDYREDWDNEICGSELNELYGANVTKTNKYSLKKVFIKPVDGTEWEELQCNSLVEYKIKKTDSFECGWTGYKSGEWTDICGYEMKQIIPTLNIDDTTHYDRIVVSEYYKTAPYPTNTDDMNQEDWVYVLNEDKVHTGFIYSGQKTKDCGCGYYYLQWDNTDEYICGSQLGDGYVSTSQYVKQIECKYCDGNFIEETENTRWTLYDGKSCECGYRVSGWSIDNTYDYVCADTSIMDTEGNTHTSGYTYYKRYYYEECVDGSNREYNKNRYKYGQASHSTSSVTECIWDEETQGNTTKRVTTYKTFKNNNTSQYEIMDCYPPIITDTKKSSECGYREEWANDGYICCGSLEFEKPLIMTINNTEGNWNRDGFVFTSNVIGNSITTDMKIYFNVNRNCTLKISYDISSESGYDKFYYSSIDSTTVSSGGYSGTKTGVTTLNVTSGDHFIILRYSKDGSQNSGRDNVIVTLSVEDTGGCTKFARYNKQYYRYSVDGGNSWIVPEPKEYRYGSLIETNSEECGYVPTLEQWVLICPDITYETAEADDGCVECQQYNNAPTMFAIEKKQRSYDRGVTWEDIYENGSLVTRTQQLLKWKAPKCGYTGDTFEDRWTDEYCENGHKYGTKTTYVSSDGGKTWVEVEGTSRIEIKEENSSECDEGTE